MSEMNAALKPPLLFISRWFPFPPDNGARIRVYFLLRELASHYTIHLLSYAEEGKVLPGAIESLSFCQTLDVLPQPVYQPGAFKALLGYFSPIPRWAVATYSAEMQAAVMRVAAAHPPQIVIASQIDMARYAVGVNAPVKILEELEVSGYIDRMSHAASLAERARRGLTWRKFRRYVAGLMSAYDAVTVVSRREQHEVVALAPQRSTVPVIIPNGVDAGLFDCNYGEPEPDTLLYSGALTYAANLDAVAYFVREIFPLVLAQRPAARLLVTGKNTPELIARLGIDDLPQRAQVTFTGYLDDIRPRVARSWVSVVPLRQGGGTRLKILESLALGTPVVATPKGAEGLDLAAGKEVLIGADPLAFANEVVSLLNSRTRRDQIAAAGKQAAARYQWQAIGSQLRDLIAGLAPVSDRPLKN